MTDLPWWVKAGIGALGGLGLGLLKLIDAKFFLGGTHAIEAQAAYLTYLAYMLLGSLAAVFLADHDLPPVKVRRSAFILGLLAPSVLLAIANQPFRPSAEGADAPKPIPRLTWVPIGEAHAQEPQGARPATGPGEEKSHAAPVEVVTLHPSAFEPTYSEAVKAALGRLQLSPQYVYVIGSTQNKEKAIEIAGKTNALLAGASPTKPVVKSKVLSVAGESTYYVVVGESGARDQALRYKAAATSTATKQLLGEAQETSLSNEDRRKVAKLLADAPVVPARELLAK